MTHLSLSMCCYITTNKFFTLVLKASLCEFWCGKLCETVQTTIGPSWHWQKLACILSRLHCSKQCDAVKGYLSSLLSVPHICSSLDHWPALIVPLMAGERDIFMSLSFDRYRQLISANKTQYLSYSRSPLQLVLEHKWAQQLWKQCEFGIGYCSALTRWHRICWCMSLCLFADSFVESFTLQYMALYLYFCIKLYYMFQTKNAAINPSREGVFHPVVWVGLRDRLTLQGVPDCSRLQLTSRSKRQHR